jgi:hypothetical protein
MPKKKLLLVTGAGASMEFGMPSVTEVGPIINAKAQQCYPLATNPNTNLYEDVERRVREYWNTNVQDHLRREPNFEDILCSVFALAGSYPAGIFTSASSALIKPETLPDINFCGREQKAVDRHRLTFFVAFAVDAVLSAFREHCRRSEREHAAEFGHLQTFVKALQAVFDVAVVTVNYDDITYRAFQGIETGFDPANGRFDEARIFDRNVWPCMLHLHGSVHFDMPPGAGFDFHEVRWQPDINADFHANATGRNAQHYREEAEFPTSAIVVGYGKTVQILRRPFRTYYSELDRLVAHSDAVLFAGYGFGDRHLNIAFERFRDDARRRPVSIIGCANDEVITIGGMEHGDHRKIVLDLFRTHPHSMQWLGHVFPSTVRDLREARVFETSSDADMPLSFWYNGMLAACQHPKRIIEQLI